MLYRWIVFFMILGFAKGGVLNVKVTGTGQFSADKTSATLRLNFQSINPGQNPTGAPSAASQGAAISQPTGKFTAYATEGLNVHNRFRAIHNVPLMTLDETMCKEAASYAADLANSGKLQHSTKEQRQGQGENLSYGCSSKAAQTVTEAVTNWYNEVCQPGYTFSTPGFQPGAGHFSQVVWKASTVLGIGKAETQSGDMKCSFIVARYKPQGNFDTGNNDYQQNVLKGSFQQDSYCQKVASDHESEFKDRASNVTASSAIL